MPIISAIFNIAVLLSFAYKIVYPDSQNILCDLIIKIYGGILICALVVFVLFIFYIQCSFPIMAVWENEPNKLKAVFYSILIILIYFTLLALGAGDGVDIPYARYLAR